MSTEKKFSPLKTALVGIKDQIVLYILLKLAESLSDRAANSLGKTLLHKMMGVSIISVGSEEELREYLDGTRFVSDEEPELSLVKDNKKDKDDLH